MTAVSNAGGLGTITGLAQKTPADLAHEIAQCKDISDKPVAVNVTFLPTVNAPDYPALIKVIIDGGMKIVETAGRNPAPVMSCLRIAVGSMVADDWPRPEADMSKLKAEREAENHCSCIVC
ncbi:hypothetical protein NBRC116589_23550 [Ruegeria sp. HU-ET01832]|uniref:nitronate monooxygenase n=1 Tax=Ruegeria sp. HU-ET01832 TaxID=3135906 RepID=UPI003102004C